ncbi:hypothetical protein ACJJIX_00055 [Microbulbifer sp. VAAC004]|uniref:hypothetical protein n=1 Tax=unclassified Microbulbifer TaxID=2619833 RepID=UPI0040390E56
MIADIEKIQKSINSKGVCPKKGFRRDVAIYELVCYVNNITGCYLSGNLDPIGVFICRARDFIHDNKEDKENREYFQLVEKYLLLMEGCLRGGA